MSRLQRTHTCSNSLDIRNTATKGRFTKKLPGTPDIAITKYRIAIFCDSEFFHGKDWEKLKLRLENGSNSTYWLKKISRNMERDQDVERTLRSREWIVIRFWGNDITKNTQDCVRVIEEAIEERLIYRAEE